MLRFCLVTTACCVLSTIAFAQGDYSIQVESHQVLVPTIVFDKDRTSPILTPAESQCTKANAEAFFKLSPDEPYIPLDCNILGEIRGLTAKDFRIFEDGVEQRIQNVALERIHGMDVRDNLARRHGEYSDTPRGKWSFPDLTSQMGFMPAGTDYFYRIAYVPTHSEQGKCHKIKVKVDRHNTFVWARNQYCDTEHSPSDPLNGMPFGKQMEAYAASGQDGKINLFLQSGFFHPNAETALVDIAVEFPWGSLNRKWTGESVATIGVLGLVYQKVGPQVARFSDSDTEGSSSDFSKAPPFESDRPHADFDVLMFPTRYETQIDLAPGEYNLEVVLSDGTMFGRVQVPLTIDRYDGKQVALSSVVLCKRFRNAAVAAQEVAAANFAPKYVPLVSKGVQFTPSGDTHFKKGEPLFAYFEVYEPLLDVQPATTVQTRLRLTNVKTGELKVDTGLRSEASWIQPGSTTISIANQIAVDKLPAGSYRLEVQASDSVGKSTVWRAAEFTVE